MIPYGVLGNASEAALAGSLEDISSGACGGFGFADVRKQPQLSARFVRLFFPC